MGLWLDEDEIVAATISDVRVNEVSLCTLDHRSALREEMLRYAETHQSRPEKPRRRHLKVYVHEDDSQQIQLLKEAGYEYLPKADRTFSALATSSATLPEVCEGFKLNTLEQENDLRKINQVLWRGFDHKGEGPRRGHRTQA